MHKQTSQELLLVFASRLELPTYFHFNMWFPLVTHFVCTTSWRPSATTPLFYTSCCIVSLNFDQFSQKHAPQVLAFWPHRKERFFSSEEAMRKLCRLCRKRLPWRKPKLLHRWETHQRRRIWCSNSVRPSGWPSTMLPWSTIAPYGTRKKLYSWHSRLQVLVWSVSLWTGLQ